ncbi:MAG: Hpt domain-containing protein [Chloroflexi bacterium]|nr:Hpt domain-containing protein [Chloroflexota bacterium]
MSQIDQSIFNTLKETTGSDFIAELIDVFLNDAPDLIAQMHSALATRDSDTFRRAAHSMKSNAATFGAMELSALAKELEIFGREKNLEIGSRLEVMEEAFRQAAVQLEELKSQP